MVGGWGVVGVGIRALITRAGMVVVQRAYPPLGKMIDVAGARLHVVELGQHEAAGPVIVMIHGASSNLGSMRRPIGDRLAQNHHVILIDRPGHGWSTRENLETSMPATQAKIIDTALEHPGISHAILLVHSLAGALGALVALDYPQRVAGLVMLAPVAYPWPGGVGTYTKIVTTPVIGPLLAYPLTLALRFL